MFLRRWRLLAKIFVVFIPKLKELRLKRKSELNEERREKKLGLPEPLIGGQRNLEGKTKVSLYDITSTIVGVLLFGFDGRTQEGCVIRRN